MVMLVWWDKKIMSMLRTWHNRDSEENRPKKRKNMEPIMKLKMIHDSTDIGIVDIAGHYMLTHSFGCKL